MKTIKSINLIGIDENVRNGRPYILDTSTTVANVAIVKIYHGQDRVSFLDSSTGMALANGCSFLNWSIACTRLRR